LGREKDGNAAAGDKGKDAHSGKRPTHGQTQAGFGRPAWTPREALRADWMQLAVEYTIASGSDVNMRRGIDPFQKRPPLTPGYSIIGKVRANGNDCSKFKTSDCVACLWKYEGQAERVNLPENYLVRVPDGVDGRTAVALILDWATAYQMLHRATHVTAGQKIFVHALSGAVGGALLRLGQLQGAQVLGTASLKRHAELRELGAVPFDYSSENWIAVIQEFGGVDAVFDPLGLESFDESYSVLKKGGVLVGYGMNCLRGPEHLSAP